MQGTDAISVRQVWRSADDPDANALVDDTGADFVVYVHDNAVLPSGFLEELVLSQRALDVDRLQPAHSSGQHRHHAR